MKTIRSVLLSAIFGISILGFTPKAEAVDYKNISKLAVGTPLTLFGMVCFWRFMVLGFGLIYIDYEKKIRDNKLTLTPEGFRSMCKKAAIFYGLVALSGIYLTYSGIKGLANK